MWNYSSRSLIYIVNNLCLSPSLYHKSTKLIRAQSKVNNALLSALTLHMLTHIETHQTSYSCLITSLPKGQRTYSFVIVSAIDSFIHSLWQWSSICVARQSCLALGPFNHELVRLCYGLVLLIKSKRRPAPSPHGYVLAPALHCASWDWPLLCFIDYVSRLCYLFVLRMKQSMYS